MIHRKWFGVSVFFLCLVVGGGAQAFVGGLVVGLSEMNEDVGHIETPFSADATFETEEMKGNTHISYTPGRVRDDIDMGAQKITMIRRFDLNKFWMLMGQGMYMEVDPEQGSEQAPQYKLVSRERIGREDVNGIPTTKYKSVYENKDGRFGGFTWFTDDNIAVKGFLVNKTRSGEKQRFKFEVTRLERGSQPDSLFEIPPGYRKFSMGGMRSMGGMQGMGNMQGGAVPPSEAGTAGVSSGSADEDASADGEDSGFAGEVAEEAKQTAEDTVKDETRRSVKDSIKKGIGSLFGRGKK